jgi:hypothetical protein
MGQEIGNQENRELGLATGSGEKSSQPPRASRSSTESPVIGTRDGKLRMDNPKATDWMEGRPGDPQDNL